MAKLYGLDVASPFPTEPSQLNRSSQFWEAANSGKQPILGSSRFWEAADSGKQPIREAADSGKQPILGSS